MYWLSDNKNAMITVVKSRLDAVRYSCQDFEQKKSDKTEMLQYFVVIKDK